MKGLYQKHNTLDAIPTVDLTNLKEVSLPTGMDYYRILWYGDSYSFEIHSGSVEGAVYVVTQEEYNMYYQIDFVFNEDQTILSEEQVADRDAKVVYYKNHTGEYKDVVYQLHDETRVVSVVERYILKTERPSATPSDTIPHYVSFYVQDGSMLYRAFFIGFAERPSVEWILSFGF